MKRVWWLILATAPAWSQQLQWDANVEPDLAGYRVYIGHQSGVHEMVVEVGLATFFQLDKSDPRERFLAVTAYDTAGNESLLSNELVYKPGSLLHPGDLNSDGHFDVADSLAFRKTYKRQRTSKVFNARADYDHSNYIGEYDRGYFEALWQNRKL
ncbi:MAG: hypothetical protein ALAOOOJD_00694 [bacterium]|nr:hypothetical protein [bacterium]